MSFLRNEVNKLLIKIKKGDEKSKEILFEKTYNHLLRVARKYVRNQNDAEDVLSEAYLRIFEYIDSFDPRQDGYNWMCKIVQRKAYDWNKKSFEYTPIDEVELPSDTVSFDEAVAEKDEVHSWLQAYSPQDQKIMDLYFWEGKTYSVIAQELGMKRSTVHKRAKKVSDEILKKHKKVDKS